MRNGVSSLKLGVVGRMTAYCTGLGLSSGCLYAVALMCPLGSIEGVKLGFALGTAGGGIAGLLMGLVSGVLMAQRTNSRVLSAANSVQYQLAVRRLSQQVVLGTVVALTVLIAMPVILQGGWVDWVVWALLLAWVPTVVALFCLEWASKKVSDWAIQQSEASRHQV